MNTRRITRADFGNTNPIEFDKPKERASGLVMCLVLIAAGALCYAFWSAVIDGIAWVFGE